MSRFILECTVNTSNYILIQIDDNILTAMEEYGYLKDEVRQNLKRNRHNHITTTYYLILKSMMRKGITSVSDLVSEKFYKFINESNNNKETSITTIDNETSIHFQENFLTPEVKQTEKNSTLTFSLNSENYLQCEESNK